MKSIIAKNRFVGFYIQDFTDELGVQPYFEGMEEFAFQGEGELFNIRRIDKVAFFRCKPRSKKLVLRPPSGNAEIIGLPHKVLRRDADRKCLLLDNITVG